MKGFLVFDTLNDVVFKQMDADLLKHITETSARNGLIAEEASEQGAHPSESIANDVLVQLFSPLVASHRVMKERMQNAYGCIYCKDQTLCIFTEFYDWTVLGINSEKEDSEAVCRKRLKVFVALIQRLFGPALQELKPHTVSGSPRSQLLARVMETYSMLRQEDQAFLFEALEQVVVNKDVASSCTKLLQEILEMLQGCSLKGEAVCHSFLLFNYRLVSSFSRRNSTLLSHGDMLLLFLILRSLHDVKHAVEDEKQKGPIHSLLVFFATALHSSIPHIVHLIRITDDILLVIVSEVSNKVLLADSLSSLLKQLHSIQEKPQDGRCRLTVDILENAITRLSDTSRRAELQKDEEICVSLITKKWAHLKMSGFVEYLSASDDAELATRSEEALLLLKKHVQTAFKELVLNPELSREAEPRPLLTTSLKLIQALTQGKLESYMGFLLVKASGGLCINSFSAQYPGLLHFVYINRTANRMLATSINSAELGAKVWRGWESAQRYCHEGSFTAMWADEDVHFSYTLWFENHAGKTVKPKCAVNPASLQQMTYPGVVSSSFYGQLMRYCFPDVSLDQLSCLEFMCVHANSVPASAILEQLQQLPLSLRDLCC
uniref:FUZ/MON1/HPS1 third Longin domain-containing protein n=1 Tax=Amblyomma maculatum TaxID=34609 RepID=G3MP45_AMBMU